MAHATDTPHLQPDKLHIGGVAARLGIPGLFIGVIALIVAAWKSFSSTDTSISDPVTHFFHAYLAAYTFFMAITLGSLAFVMIHYLARVGWSVVVRRAAEALAMNIFLLVILTIVFFIPVHGVDGVHRLFPHWFVTLPEQHDDLLLSKWGYLNPRFFAIRMGIYLTVWCLMAWFYASKSAQQDQDGDARLTVTMEKVSYPAIFFFGFSLTAFIFDWVMSLNPHWFSTMFGVYFFAGCMLSAFSSITLLMLALQKRGLIGNAVNHEHYHDLGKWMFAFTFFWGYIAFSQYMLIWYANMPEETQFFSPRQFDHWATVSIILLVVHLLIPFPGLLSRIVKRRNNVLAFWAVWSVCACAVDICYLVIPNEWINRLPALAAAQNHTSPEQYLPNAMAQLVDKSDVYHILDPQVAAIVNYPLQPLPLMITLLCFIGIGGLYVFATMLALRGKSLVPTRDPRLNESLAFENI